MQPQVNELIFISKYELLKRYISTQSTSVFSYIIEIVLFTLFGWIIGIPGILIRWISYGLLISHEGFFAIEPNVNITRPREIFLGKNVFIDYGATLRSAKGGIKIGKGTRIMNNAKLDVLNHRNLEQSGINIGENCIVGSNSILYGAGGLVIRNNVVIGPMVTIVPGNHVYSNPREPIRNQGVTAKGIEIEEDVWIGSNATILDGVRICRGSVIGAGSVVTRDIPPNSLAVGVPAKVAKKIRQIN